ncbi:TonB-dependent siderophore receptor [Nostoc sp. 'Lobaria pulmonaria (5183) cyanobiont']|uniref:TonB-dependent siderophore receptor n=1 Tax=Nostoc sp. 'Lobaria pulmonaria (5183) cyanobiont' TaxID=1618022 RepID=UPI000CF31B69|nr:TonB-dependent siderophore receptor [Nostoc sp. 'Lobaria pulmonaria (5183) cyanobiont']AVH69345.1 TonB-dependent siderophore receptor [Nostoc sp. 'Lobaria pulmonaria (5183) cyanobiont']
MKLSRSFFISCFLVAVIVKPGQAKEVTKISPIQEPNHFARTVKEWLAQIEQQQTPQLEVVQVTGVKANPTNKGVEVILQTSKGQQLQLVNRSTGSNFITDIPNAQLRLPSGKAFTFRSEKPIAGVTQITVTNFDANTIRVSAIGEVGIPTVELFDSPDEGLIFSVATAASTAQQPQTQPTPEQQPPESQTQPEPSTQGDEPIELVVTGEQDGYRVTDSTTATRTDTPQRDIPQSIQVIPQQVIKDQQITRIGDATRNVSGVTQQGGYGGSTDNYNIRGFTTYDNLRNGFAVPDDLVNPTNIERIEVLKGPASVLYGQFEPGGVVNYITKQPLSEPYYSAEFTAGNFSTYRPSIDISGPLNSDKTLLYRLNAAYENFGSFLDFNHQETFAIAPALTYKIGDATTLTLEYEYLKVDRTFYRGLTPDPIVFQAPLNRFLGEPDDYFSKETNSVFLNVNHRFSKNIQFRSGFSVTVNNSEESAFQPDIIDVDGHTVLRRFGAGPAYYQNYSLQNDLISNFNTGSIQHQVLLGLEWNKNIRGYDYLRSTASLTPSIDLFNPVYGASRPPEFDEAAERDRFDRNTIALYLQDQVTLLPNLKLLVGGRYDFIHRKNRVQLLDSLGRDPIDDATVDRLYNEAFSPRVGIVYQPIEPISIYASYSRSFNPSDSRTVDGTQLPPERGTQYEVGLKAELIKDRLSATFAAYDITKENVATTDPTPGNSDFSIAAGEVKSRGLEFDVSGQILPGWNVIASAFINDAFVSKDNSLPVGDSLVNAAGSGASLWTSYEIQNGNWKGFGFGGGLFYTGDREAELPNTFKIPSYVRADATIFYKRDNWRVGLNFKNLFDTRYYDSQGYYLLPGAPLTVLGTFSVQF